MISVITTWLLNQGFVMILGFASKAITDYLADQRHEDELRETAKLQEHNRQLEDALRVEHQLAEEAAKRVSEDDALKRLEAGTA